MIQLKRIIPSFSILIAVALCGGIVSKPSPNALAPIHTHSANSFSAPALTGDFDGDGFADSAAAIYGHEIQINLTGNFEKTSLKVPSVGLGIRVLALDIDYDKDPDILVMSATSLLPVAVWLNDGKGHFTQANPLYCLAGFLDSPSRYSYPSDQTNATSPLPLPRYFVYGLSRTNFNVRLESAGLLCGSSPAASLHIRANSFSTRSPPFFAS